MNAESTVLHGRPLVGGAAAGELLVARAPLSFWGGYDSATGEIIDRRHPLAGQVAAGRILALPYTIGSSTTTAVLLEAVRAGTAPAAILTASVDSFLALAAIVADVLYARPLPVVAIGAEAFAALRDGQWAQLTPGGDVVLTPEGSDGQ